MFSSMVCQSVLFCMSLCEAMRVSTQSMQARMRLIVRTLAWCTLGAVVPGNAVLPVLNRYHYSADVAVALVLALLVYGNPAIAIAVQHWADGGGAESLVDATLPLSLRDSGT